MPAAISVSVRCWRQVTQIMMRPRFRWESAEAADPVSRPR